MADIEKFMFSEISAQAKEEFKGDFYLDDKVLVSKTIINIDSAELNECEKSDEIKPNLVSTDMLKLSPTHVTDNNIIMDTNIKQELPSDPNLYNTIIDYNIKVENNIVGDIKIEFSNKLLFCNNCNEYYEEYCTKCGMLICVLNGNGLNNMGRKEIPAEILEIKQGLFGGTGIFALKTIPKGVKFGPFTGFSRVDSCWRLKGGKFVFSNDKLESLNWMQYVNCARNFSDQNLHAFQYEDNLYYSSVCEIQEGEELLVYFGEEYEEGLNSSMEMVFIPHIEKDVKDVFACTYCCLGFSLKVYLVEHKTICPNGTSGNFEELVQCESCKIYMETKEYLECHKSYCGKVNAKHGVLLALDDQGLKGKSLSPITNKRNMPKITESKYKSDPKNHTNRHQLVKKFRCGICYKSFKKNESLKLHVENIHTAIKHKHFMRSYQKDNIKNTEEKNLNSHHKGKRFRCLKCKFQTNNKHYLKLHVKTIHLKAYDYNCTECEYKTNEKKYLTLHMKTKHLKEYDYNCIECEFKTNSKAYLKIHMKSKHLEEYEYNCMECGYKTSQKIHLEEHVKTIHIKIYDYNCTECEYKTNQKSNLVLHVKTKHLKVYDYNCIECEYKTNNKMDLTKHTKTKHLKVYDYNCMECEYKTNEKANLKVHKKTKHLKEYDYNCIECEYKTNAKPSFESHTKTKHRKENDINYGECDYKTKRKLELETLKNETS